MIRKFFDVAVLGLGTMGAFACLEIARRKASVIGFDQFAPPHHRGSHSGDTRVYREAYAEHPDYVPIARRAGELWDRFGTEEGAPFLHRCGVLSMGTADSALIAGIRTSAAQHEIDIEELSPRQISARFPAFTPPPDVAGIFERAAGWLDVNAALAFGLRRARQFGAEVRLNVAVEAFERDGGHFRIRTAAGPVLAERLVITAGAWADHFLADLGLPLRVLRKVLIWVDPLNPDLFLPGAFPIFLFSDRFLYGFPNIGGAGVKFGIHHDPHSPVTQAGIRQPVVEPCEIEPALQMASTLLPELAGPLPGAFDRVVQTATCLYTMTPDEHFILDRHPRDENISIAAGFSGHGFKFAPVIGEGLADLALSGRTLLPIGFLGLAGRISGSP